MHKVGRERMERAKIPRMWIGSTRVVVDAAVLTVLTVECYRRYTKTVPLRLPVRLCPYAAAGLGL